MLEKLNKHHVSKNLNGLFEIRKDIREVRYDMCEEFWVKIVKLLKK
jgi:hypothetical protein